MQNLLTVSLACNLDFFIGLVKSAAGLCHTLVADSLYLCVVITCHRKVIVTLNSFPCWFFEDLLLIKAFLRLLVLICTEEE